MSAYARIICSGYECICKNNVFWIWVGIYLIKFLSLCMCTGVHTSFSFLYACTNVFCDMLCGWYWLYIYIYIYIYIYKLHFCMHARTYFVTCSADDIDLQMYMYISIYICIHIHIFVHIYIYIYKLHFHFCMHART